MRKFMFRPVLILIFSCLFSFALHSELLAGSATLSWQRNSETDLGEYRVYYGVRSRSYGSPVPVGKATTYTLNGLQEETRYYFAVTARDTSGNESGYSAEVSKLIESSVSAATSVSLVGNPPSATVGSGAIRFTAQGGGGTGSYEYRFWLSGPSTGNQWVVKRDYSASNTWDWVPTAADIGKNQIGVHVRSAGSSAELEALSTLGLNVSQNEATPNQAKVTLNAVPAAGVQPDQVATFYSGVPGASGNREYRFWLKGPSTGNAWVIKQGYSTVSTWQWRPATADEGLNQIGVHTRTVGSTADLEDLSVLEYQVGVPAATGVSLNASRRSPRSAGASISFVAAGQGGTGRYEYRFWLKGPSTEYKWIIQQDYSIGNTWRWRTGSDDVGLNQVGVHVRSLDSKSDLEALSVLDYEIR